MIEGLRFRVSSEELRNHCASKAIYHLERAKVKQEQVDKMKALLEGVKAESSGPLTFANGMPKSSYHSQPDNVVEDLENDITSHRNRAYWFRFCGNHLFDQDYLLSDNDLTTLEITKR